MNGVTARIIGCAFRVTDTLGVGFPEKVNGNALAHEIREAELAVMAQRKMGVPYDDIIIGEFVADFLIEDQIIVELKTAKALGPEHQAQYLNYLRTTNKRLCMLINFGKSRLEIKRIAA